MDNTDYIYNESKKEYNISVKNIVAATLTGIVVVILAVYGIFYSVQYHKQEIVIQNHTEQTFGNMMEYVNTAQDYMLKALASSSETQRALMLSEARRYTLLAEEDLSSLPIDESAVEHISDYLVTLGDIMGAWSKKAAGGDTLTTDEYSTLVTLYGYSQDLSSSLNAINMDILQGKNTWKNITKNSKTVAHSKVIADRQENLKRLSDPFTNLPQLEYDGKFSKHICKIEPRGLSGDDITKEAGEQIARDIIAMTAGEYGKIKYTGTHTINNIEVFNYSVSNPSDDSIMAYMDITKKGGMLCSLMIIADNGEASLDIDQATESGKSFLEELDYQNMEPVYRTQQGNYLTVSYVYTKDEVMYYPDICKVKIALDSGKIVGFDGHGYLCCHENRYLKIPAFSLEEGEEYISNKLEITESREAVILTEYMTEEHVYEYRCSAHGREFLVHLDPQSGKEVQILLLIEDDAGLMAI